MHPGSSTPGSVHPDWLLENALDAVVGMDEDQRVIYWNRRAEETFAWSKSEAIGRPMSELIVPVPYREAHRQGMKRFLETGRGRILGQRIEIEALDRTGRVFPVELTVVSEKTSGGWIFYSFIRDISKEKSVDAERQHLLKEAQEAIRMRDELLSVCSHELKTPLTSMKLQFQLALRQVNRNDPSYLTREATTKRIESTLTQLNRLNRLIDDMLDLSRIATGKLHLRDELFDFSSVCAEVVERFSLPAPAGSDIRPEIHGPLTIRGDSDRADQIVTNLLTNAIRYGAGQPIAIRLREDGGSALFEIEDRGIGIAEEHLARIFEKFERAVAPSVTSGLGIGLYITRQIIEAMGGNISVRSVLGQGSVFSVRLPLA